MKWRALLLALALLVCVDRARATNITVTITGTISSGTDTTNMWGYGVNGSLAGAAFTATYTFNDTLGTNSPTGSPSYIWTPTGSTTSPGTATVTIGLFTHSFGTGSSPSSLAQLYDSSPPSVGGYAKYTTTDNITDLQLGITPTAYGLVGNWETSIPSGTAVNAWSNNYFTYSDITNNQSSIAYLTPTSIQVTGIPYGCGTPTGESTAFTGWNSTSAGFTMTLTPAVTSFSGASVQEIPGGQGDDACWDAYHNGTWDPLDGITGGSWAVGASNIYGVDGVGYNSNAISFYRSHNVEPCGTTVYQQMQMYCPLNDTYYSYGTTNAGSVNTLHEYILNSTQIQSSRADVPSTVENQ